MQAVQNLSELKWPSLDDIKTTLDEKKCIEIFIHSVANNYKFKEECKFESFVKQNAYTLHSQSFVTPISITFLLSMDKINHIILMLNSKRGRVFTDGANDIGRPKTCFDLISGNFFVKKRVINREGKIISKFLGQHIQGLPFIAGYRTINKKIQYFEELFEGSLLNWIGNEKLQSTFSKVTIINDLIRGLLFIHRIRVRQKIRFVNGIDKTFEHATCHRDLKPHNMLVKKDHACITDFDLANMIEGIAGSPGYMHPLLFKQKKINIESAKLMADYGTKFDMWSLGLIIVEVLLNKFSTKAHIAPLQFLEKRIKNKDFCADVSQEEIDNEMAKIKDSLSCYALKALWQIATSMLKIDPVQTITVDEAAMESYKIMYLFKMNEEIEAIKTLLREIQYIIRQPIELQFVDSQFPKKPSSLLSKAIFKVDQMLLALQLSF